MSAFGRALIDGLEATLAKPVWAALITAGGLAGSLVAVAVSAVAGAIAIIVLFLVLAVLFAYALRQRALFEGPYRVISDKTVWDLADPTGAVVTVERTLRVIFNYPSIAIDDSARGDGDLFAHYVCEFGHVVHRSQVGDLERVIIALDERKKRGDEADLVSRRTIVDGFLSDQEWCKLALEKPTARSEFVVMFPRQRPPTQVFASINGDRHEIQPEIEGGRALVRKVMHRPKVGRSLLIEWSW